MVSNLDEELCENDSKQCHKEFDKGTSAESIIKNSNSKLIGPLCQNRSSLFQFVINTFILVMHDKVEIFSCDKKCTIKWEGKLTGK